MSIEGKQSTQNWVANNSIGTDISGTHVLENGVGILVSGGAHDNVIGDPKFGRSGNVISGKTNAG